MIHTRSTKFVLALAGMLTLAVSGPLQAADGGYTLAVRCSDAAGSEPGSTIVEIYVPDRMCCGGFEGLLKGLKRKQKGYYALDLTSIGKGKPLEPVHLQVSQRPAGLLVTQYTRGLPTTLIPRDGGKVSFDPRFAAGLKCTALFDTSRLE